METGVLLIIDALAPLIDHWRRDSWESLEPPIRLSEAVPPHVTMLWPWHPDPHDENALRRLRRAVGSVPAFELRLRQVAAFEGGAVFLEPDPSSGLDGLFTSLVHEFPEYPPYGGRHDKVRLHVTVSVGGGAELAAEVAAAGIDVTVEVDALTLGVIAPPGRWEPLYELPLSKAKDRVDGGDDEA